MTGTCVAHEPAHKDGHDPMPKRLDISVLDCTVYHLYIIMVECLGLILRVI